MDTYKRPFSRNKTLHVDGETENRSKDDARLMNAYIKLVAAKSYHRERSFYGFIMACSLVFRLGFNGREPSSATVTPQDAQAAV